ncbi:naphthalene 1,2-dioxygenase [Klebsiella pneumoniae]|uniref:Naphthalene 1,2-dioxygenase n=1 Tax=Klebsiella pneumoniae TaxID=573 RepID=A0A2X3D2H8_KLEPN|nr:naphthalene 1,2-dioxygenase [Klebsiella pneumoniae]
MRSWSQGFVEDGKVECPLHEAVFDVKTGQCLHGPSGRNLNRYPVRVYAIRSRLPLSRRTWHERIPGLQPGATGKRQFTPPAEGGNGNIHKPGDYHNLIWQTRSRVPENWELQLIATLETLFEQGAESLGELVNGLNGVRMHDQQGEPWSESSFQAFLQVNGY